MQYANGKIVKKNGKYYLYSKDGTKKLGGPYDSRKKAEKREDEIRKIKHAKE